MVSLPQLVPHTKPQQMPTNCIHQKQTSRAITRKHLKHWLGVDESAVASAICAQTISTTYATQDREHTWERRGEGLPCCCVPHADDIIPRTSGEKQLLGVLRQTNTLFRLCNFRNFDDMHKDAPDCKVLSMVNAASCLRASRRGGREGRPEGLYNCTTLTRHSHSITVLKILTR